MRRLPLALLLLVGALVMAATTLGRIGRFEDGFSSLDGGSVAGPMRLESVGVGIPGDRAPYEKLEVDNGNALITSPNEQGFMVQRSGQIGPRLAPTFSQGRIVLGGIWEPEWRLVYQDYGNSDGGAALSEIIVMAVENTGTIASVRNPGVSEGGSSRGSFFEGFTQGDTSPTFRLNSYPDMKLELGPGGSGATDVEVARNGANVMELRTAGTQRVQVDNSGLTIGDTNGAPISKSPRGFATLNFGSISSGACEDLTVSVTDLGADADIAWRVPNGALVAGSTYFAWPSASGVATFRHCCVGAATCDPPSTAGFSVRGLNP